MGKRIYRIAGQAPKVRWKRNARRKKRTIKKAVAIAVHWGVHIPDDVAFVEADPAELRGSLKELIAGGEMETARGPEMSERRDGYVYWHDHYNIFGKILFRIHPEVLTSDEGIVGVIEHEMYELRQFREVFELNRRRRMNGADYGRQVSPGRRGNFHDQAWDAADEAVLRMRKAKQG
jgi:hypothetical protein